MIEIQRCWKEQRECRDEIIVNGNWNIKQAIYGLKDWIAEEIMIMREFSSGATRSTDTINDPEGFLSPLVISRYNEYMCKHRVQDDGNVRASDNWQKGIPKDSYMKSGFRHFLDRWLAHRGYVSRDGLEEALCAEMFNCMGHLHEMLKERNYLCQEIETPPKGTIDLFNANIATSGAQGKIIAPIVAKVDKEKIPYPKGSILYSNSNLDPKNYPVSELQPLQYDLDFNPDVPNGLDKALEHWMNGDPT
jgi:hypothetical protein